MFKNCKMSCKAFDILTALLMFDMDTIVSLTDEEMDNMKIVLSQPFCPPLNYSMPCNIHEFCLYKN